MRAIIVLAVSAMDSYFHDIVLENAPRIAMAFSRGQINPPGKLLEAIKISLTPEKALRLIGRGRPDEEIRKLLADHIKERTYQDPGDIERALRLIEIDDFWEELRKKLRLKTQRQTKAHVLDFVGRRHKIVHEADTYKSKRYHDQLRPISVPFTKDCVRKIALFVMHLDKIISTRIAQKLGTA